MISFLDNSWINVTTEPCWKKKQHHKLVAMVLKRPKREVARVAPSLIRGWRGSDSRGLLPLSVSAPAPAVSGVTVADVFLRGQSPSCGTLPGIQNKQREKEN